MDRLTFNSLNQKFLNGTINEHEKKQLEQFKVKNAIILAAGFSSRFIPFSYTTPKGLLNVKGEILIERIIRQLHEKEIFDITIVVGYKKELFYYLKEKYNVRMIENPDFYFKNTHSSIYFTRDFLDNTYIVCSDNYYVDNIFEEYVYDSYYSAIFFKGKTNEYLLDLDMNNLITKVTIGGSDKLAMFGQVYFSRAFSKEIKRILEIEWNNKRIENYYWEDIYMEHMDTLHMYANIYTDGIIHEFDSLEELREFDDKYINNSGLDIFSNICKQLKCKEYEIVNITPLNSFGLKSFAFSFASKRYYYQVVDEIDKLINPSIIDNYVLLDFDELYLDNNIILKNLNNQTFELLIDYSLSNSISVDYEIKSFSIVSNNRELSKKMIDLNYETAQICKDYRQNEIMPYAIFLYVYTLCKESTGINMTAYKNRFRKMLDCGRYSI